MGCQSRLFLGFLWLLARVNAQDVWASVYSSENCATATLASEQSLPASDTCVQYSVGGYTLSLNFQCVGITEDSAWSASVYNSGDCSGTALMSLAGSDACDCQGQSFFFGQVTLGISVSCTGEAPTTCAPVTLAPTATPQPGTSSPVWGAIYSSLDCETDSFLVDGVVDVDNGGCLGSTINGMAVSMSFTCNGFTAESSWSAGVYITSDCTGFQLFTLSAADACTCGGLSLSGYTLGAHVNCGGEEEPSCEGGDGGDGSSSNGSGSDGGMNSTGILLIVVLVMGFLITLILGRAIYNWQCKNKQKREMTFLSDDDFTVSVDKDHLCGSQGEHPSSL